MPYGEKEDDSTKIKMLFILGSHRQGGNSEFIKYLVQNHKYYERIEPVFLYLNSKKIQECKSCYMCTKIGKCILDDDMEEIVEIMKKSDSIIFVPVVYGFGVGSTFQAFLERAGYGYLRTQGRPLRDKIAGIAIIGRRYAHEPVAHQLMMNILLNEMVMYGSGFLPLFEGRSFPGEIQNDEEAILSFDAMITRIVEVNNKERK